MAHVITDYMARGLDAAKPAVPNIGAGETGMYWATDTNKLYTWTGTAWLQTNTGVGGPSIVQSKTVFVAALSTGITLASVPTVGNLLVALVSDQTTGPSPGAGWTMMSGTSAVVDGYGIFWKYASGAQVALQKPSNDAGHSGSITIYEMNNCVMGQETVVLDWAAGTAVLKQPLNPKQTGGGGLILGMFVNQSLTGPTSLTGTGVTADTQVSGLSRCCQPFHITGPVGGLNNVTANYATSQGGVFVAVACG